MGCCCLYDDRGGRSLRRRFECSVSRTASDDSEFECACLVLHMDKSFGDGIGPAGGARSLIAAHMSDNSTAMKCGV